MDSSKRDPRARWASGGARRARCDARYAREARGPDDLNPEPDDPCARIDIRVVNATDLGLLPIDGWAAPAAGVWGGRAPCYVRPHTTEVFAAVAPGAWETGIDVALTYRLVDPGRGEYRFNDEHDFKHPGTMRATEILRVRAKRPLVGPNLFTAEASGPFSAVVLGDTESADPRVTVVVSGGQLSVSRNR
jgi:hypothetical protein